MKTMTRAPRTDRMSHDAYAGFLKLWLTPGHRPVDRTPEIDAYLRHANERAPLSDAARRAAGLPTGRAA